MEEAKTGNNNYPFIGEPTPDFKTHTVYIAGPMKGIPQFNFPAFFQAQHRWEKEGHEVINPAAQPGEETNMTEEEVVNNFSWFMRRDIYLVMDCTAITVLPNWVHSRGAMFEAHLATVLDIPIFRSSDPRCRWPIKGVQFEVR